MASGSAATLVTSTMQLTGEITQSYILDAIVGSSIGNLAILIYLISAVGFLISVAFFQNYKMGLWLVIGPALWNITSNTRNEEVNVNWMYAGQVIKDQDYLYNYTYSDASDLMDLSAGPAKLYVMWDGVVSGVVQNLTALISNISKDPATRLFARATIQEGMLGATIGDPDVREAMKIAIGPRCTPMVNGGNASSSNRWGPVEIQELEDALRARHLVTSLPESMLRKFCRVKFVHQAWAMGSPSSYDELFNSWEAKECEMRNWEDLDEVSTLTDCYGLSVAVWQALEVEAERKLRELYNTAGGDAFGNSELDRSLLPKWSLDMLAQDSSSLRKLVASYATRNEMDSLNYLGKHTALTESGGSAPDKDSSAAAIIGWLEKESAQSQAVFFFEAVPYIQGALLYFLAIVYPFICMIMLIPGFHSALFTWMGAWAWVKSWDLMFYVISLLSGIMSEQMIHMGMLHSNLKFNDVITVDGSVSDFGSTMAMKLEDVNFLHLAVYSLLDGMDPKFSAGIINYILAITTISIPAITGMFFLWGRAEGLAFLPNALKNLSGEASDRTKAQANDQLLREMELTRQKEVRETAAQSLLAGAVVGGAVGGIPGALIAGGIGSLVGENLGNINVGLDRGKEAALQANRPLVLPTGDVLDPLEFLKTASTFYFYQGFINETAGIMSRKDLNDDRRERYEIKASLNTWGG